MLSVQAHSHAHNCDKLDHALYVHHLLDDGVAVDFIVLFPGCGSVHLGFFLQFIVVPSLSYVSSVHDHSHAHNCDKLYHVLYVHDLLEDVGTVEGYIVLPHGGLPTQL